MTNTLVMLATLIALWFAGHTEWVCECGLDHDGIKHCYCELRMKEAQP